MTVYADNMIKRYKNNAYTVKDLARESKNKKKHIKDLARTYPLYIFLFFPAVAT